MSVARPHGLSDVDPARKTRHWASALRLTYAKIGGISILCNILKKIRPLVCQNVYLTVARNSIGRRAKV